MRSGIVPELFPKGCITQQRSNRGSKRRMIPLMYQQPRPAIGDHLGYTSMKTADHGNSHRLRLREDDAKPFAVTIRCRYTRRTEDASGPQVLTDDRGWLCSQEAARDAKLFSMARQVTAQGTIADDREETIRVGLLHGSHGANQIGAALLLHQPADEEDARAGYVGGRCLELLQIDPDVMNAKLLLWKSCGDGAVSNEMRDA